MQLLPTAALVPVLLAAWDFGAVPPPESGPQAPAAVGTFVDREGGFCTATLIAEATALTAAHCLYGEDARTIVAPFVFRTRDPATGQPLEARVTGWILPSTYKLTGWTGEPHLRHLDWLILTLDTPIGATAGFIPVADAPSEALLAAMAGGYSYVGFGHSEGASGKLYDGCRIGMWNIDGTFFDHCATVEGDSGGPALATVEGTLSVVGVVSAELPSSADLSVSSLAFGPAVTALLTQGEGAAKRLPGLATSKWTPARQGDTVSLAATPRARPGTPGTLSLTCRKGALSLAVEAPAPPATATPGVTLTVDLGQEIPIVGEARVEGGVFTLEAVTGDLLARMLARAQTGTNDDPPFLNIRYQAAGGAPIEISYDLQGFPSTSARLRKACPAPAPT